MAYQKIDGVSYANGVKLNVQDIEIWEIEKSLDTLTTQIEIKKIPVGKKYKISLQEQLITALF